VRNHPLLSCFAALTLGVLLAGAVPAVAGAEPSAVVRWYGDTSSATGNALSQGRCDVDGDGTDDLIVGAWFWDKAPTSNIGAAYVLFGGEAVDGGDLNVPGEVGAARIDGPSVANAFVGFSVGCLGDVDGDGIDDLGISYYTEERIFVVLGAEEFGSIDLTNLGDRGYEVRGDITDVLNYNVGYSLSGVGDYNDDGLDDYAVAGVVADTQGRTNNGRIWIVAGKEGVANVDLIAPAEGDVLATIDGAGNEDRLGSSAVAGDVNNDGVDDLVVGAYTSTPWGPSVAVPGQAWVVFGGSGPAIDLAGIGTAGFAIRGPQRQRDRLGISVSAAGDINNDSFDDVIIGGDGVYNAATGQRQGTTFVVFGSASTATVYTDPAATDSIYTCGTETVPGTCDAGQTQPRGYSILGADSDPGNGTEATGYSLSGIGDVNGDELPDFAIGAYGYDPVNPASPASPATTMSGAGAVWVVYGKTSTATQNLATITAGEGYRIDGLAAGDRFGRQVGVVGDLDGNGVTDFAAAGDFAPRPLPPGTPRTQAGEVAIALQGALTTETALTTSATGPVAVGETFDLASTTTQLAAGGGPVTGGTVTFSADGTAIEGCAAIPVDPADGAAECAGASIAGAGTTSTTATFDGTATLAPSTSEPVEQVVEPLPTCAGQVATVVLAEGGEVTSGPDVVTGTPEADVVDLLPGADVACGGSFGDRFQGGYGPDTLYGGYGPDTLSGSNGDDLIYGGYGGDTIYAGPGTDTITCGPGTDRVYAHTGDRVAGDCEVVSRA
jgi:hypothetical protein